jgi:hypothetical protein
LTAPRIQAYRARMHHKTAARGAAVLMILLLAGSCSVRQNITIKADGSGTAGLRVVMSMLLKDYLVSLAEVSGRTEAAKGAVFDLAAIRKGFEGRQGVTVRRLESPAADTLELDLSYRSLSELFASDAASGTGAVSLKDAEGLKTLRVHLDRKNFRQLTGAFPVLADPAFAGFGPLADDTMTEKDYLSMIEFSLGPDSPALVQKSFLELTVRPEGQIERQTGGAVSGGAVTFRVPLLSLLVLEKPLDYSVSWR